MYVKMPSGLIQVQSFNPPPFQHLVNLFQLQTSEKKGRLQTTPEFQSPRIMKFFLLWDTSLFEAKKHLSHWHPGWCFASQLTYPPRSLT